MTLQIQKQVPGGSLIRAVEEMSGVSLAACYQCRKCSSGCPVAKYTAMPPSEIVRRLQFGAGNELLDSELIWVCLSCETCYARCPMGINVSAAIDALRALALETGAQKPRGDMPLFNRMFLGTVQTFGRAYDLSMIMAYKIRTRNFRQDTEKMPAMLRKRKLALLPPSGADKKTVKRIFAGTRRDGGAGK